MYFKSRMEAGAILAEQLMEKYRYENCAVVALGEGGVLIGEQIAVNLHCVLMMLLSEGIAVPGEGVDFGAMSQSDSLLIIANSQTVRLRSMLVNFMAIWRSKNVRLIKK